MRGRLLIASATMLLLFGAGLGVRAWVLDADEDPVDEAVPTASPPVGARPPGPPAARDAGGEAGRSAPRSVVTSVEGRVLRRAPSGESIEVRVGETVPVDETLLTGDGAATLHVDRVALVELERQTAVTIAEGADGRTGVRLDRGRTTARVEDSGSTFRLTFADSDAVAETADGELSAVTDGAGRVTVASERGTVRLSAEGEAVDIAEGEQSTVLPERSPTPPRRVPPSFFLRVRRPPERSRVAETTVRGRAAPGAVVSVNGAPARVDDDGRFQASLTLREGRNRIVVEGRDVRGRSDSSSHSVLVDSSASEIQSDVAW
jgi:hypothetical protein